MRNLLPSHSSISSSNHPDSAADCYGLGEVRVLTEPVQRHSAATYSPFYEPGKLQYSSHGYPLSWENMRKLVGRRARLQGKAVPINGEERRIIREVGPPQKMASWDQLFQVDAKGAPATRHRGHQPLIAALRSSTTFCSSVMP